ncbi:MAG: GTP-binding protein LepA [Candidatus Nomurabacteria bacterium GW2011_GWA2_40_9]|uniref:Elongation factor 4 n=1 Tax=Candidatus Nomurabacteria bacterium GW2011_GWA2_40_9 TaxID=1618734 RepID=A0A0G0TS52_9BACT|nr:MAG: GTP-binding protein LepA [Candidatus Nomurabacteria bacterium GW2011_GWA2_40_9]
MDLKHIRNFSIIAHIDHGKSTLADRMLEITKTIEVRKMRDQVLDSMELERERGITIKMQPVRMIYHPDNIEIFKYLNLQSNSEFILNLIDTPGHIDFSYEVSRALKAVEGSILLVDSTQGVQAQTLTTLNMARNAGLKIIPVLSKIDSPLARIEEVKEEVVNLLDCDPDEILLVSGKTGEGVDNLLQEIIKRVPSPTSPCAPLLKGEGRFGVGPESQRSGEVLRALVFDFKYSNHKGVIVFVRILDGKIKKGDNIQFSISGEKFTALEVGTFSPEETPRDSLQAGDTGYIVTGIKKPGIASVGDTITMSKNPVPPIEGYAKPLPVVWASVFPEDADDFLELKLALGKLKLSDSAFSYEEESSGSLGRGFRSGFLGMLHLEIITERLRREFNLNLVITTPSITYEVLKKNGKKEKVYSPYFFPDDNDIVSVFEPWVNVKIITPAKYLGNIMQLIFDHEGEVGDTENFGDTRSSISVKMPLRELMRNFFDELKSTSSGYGSISYEIEGMREANVTRLDILVADEVIPAFSRVVSAKRVEEEAEKAVEKLHSILPRQMFVTKIQGKANNRIISSRTIQAFRKDVTGYLYGGDITRKNKLLDKQKKGKKKMKDRGRVNISQDVFLKMMRSEL